MNALVPIQAGGNVEAYRASTDAAEMCKEIVVASAQTIQGRKYIKVEGWQAIAVAHGCTASACNVERVEGGVRATGQVRRMSDGVVIAEAEGFVGEDEPTWFGGEVTSYGKTKVLPRRADYAIRAMAQTRAISRACRSAFAHVVVMMNAGLSTTPAEEVPDGGFDHDQPAEPAPSSAQRPSATPKLISERQRQELMDLAVAKGIDAKTLCEVGGVDSVKEIPAAMFDQAKAWILRQKPRTPGPSAPASDLVEDEIPY